MKQKLSNNAEAVSEQIENSYIELVNAAYIKAIKLVPPSEREKLEKNYKEVIAKIGNIDPDLSNEVMGDTISNDVKSEIEL